MRKDVIVVDLDGTLCNCEHRQELARAKQWDQFHAHLTMDQPNHDVAEFVRDMSYYYTIVALTGRNESFRQLTWSWLTEHKLEDYIDQLIMRPDNDWRPDHELKIEMLEKALGSKDVVMDKVLFVLDDRDKVVEAFRNYGLPCWQVRPGSY